jgi:hypothetical protein
MTGWSRYSGLPEECGYKNCHNKAVTKAQRVKAACFEHAMRPKPDGTQPGSELVEIIALLEAGRSIRWPTMWNDPWVWED